MFTNDKSGKSWGSSGFTLVELMVILVVFAILVLIAIPVFSNNIDRAEEMVCKSNQYQLRSAEEAYFYLHGEHSEEYRNLTVIPEDSEIMMFFNEGVPAECPGDGGYYYWAERDGQTMIFCSEHGSVNPAVINVPPPVPVTLTIYGQLSQNYPDEDIIYIEYSENKQTFSRNDEMVVGTEFDDIIAAKGGDDLLDGGEGNDRLIGNNGKDGLFGGAGDDTLLGGGGADIISGGEGDDYINGGSGSDLVIYDKDITAYEIVEYRNGRYYITDTETGEVDDVRNVENFQFGDNDPVIRNDLPTD